MLLGLVKYWSIPEMTFKRWNINIFFSIIHIVLIFIIRDYDLTHYAADRHTCRLVSDIWNNLMLPTIIWWGVSVALLQSRCSRDHPEGHHHTITRHARPNRLSSHGSGQLALSCLAARGTCRSCGDTTIEPPILSKPFGPEPVIYRRKTTKCHVIDQQGETRLQQTRQSEKKDEKGGISSAAGHLSSTSNVNDFRQ